MSSISVVDSLDEDTEKKMREGFVAYEASHGIDVNYNQFTLVMRDDEEAQVIGVLNAYTAFSEIYIDDIWVDSAHRHKGYGRALIAELESMFEDKGFNNINLVTSAFQAPGFYEKCGFTAEFTRENKHNPKLSKTFFVKFFKNENQYQGLTAGSK